MDYGTDPLEGRWYAVLPISPATQGDEVLLDGVDFEGAWENIAGYAPTAYKKAIGGTRFRLSVTGDEGTPGSTIFTLPVGFRTLYKRRLWAQLGADGRGLAAVEDNPDGTVVFVGEIGVTI